MLGRKRRVISQLDQIRFLEGFFENKIDGNVLIELNRVVGKKEVRKEQIVLKSKNKWVDDLYIVFDGKYDLYFDGELIQNIEGVFGCQSIPSDVEEYKIECVEPGAILKIGREQLFNIMFDHTELIESILLKIPDLNTTNELK